MLYISNKKNEIEPNNKLEKKNIYSGEPDCAGIGSCAQCISGVLVNNGQRLAKGQEVELEEPSCEPPQKGRFTFWGFIIFSKERVHMTPLAALQCCKYLKDPSLKCK